MLTPSPFPGITKRNQRATSIRAEMKIKKDHKKIKWKQKKKPQT